jgi:hypothetical protein
VGSWCRYAKHVLALILHSGIVLHLGSSHSASMESAGASGALWGRRSPLPIREDAAALARLCAAALLIAIWYM